jgi:hypothetical protein
MTASRLARIGWWPTARADVISFCQTCHPCRARATPTSPSLGHMKLFEEPTGPFQVLHMDNLHPIPPNDDGFTNLLVIVDRFSAYLILAPTRTGESKEIASAINMHLIRHFGPGRVWIKDNAHNLNDETINSLADMYHVDSRNPLPGEPQGNGMAERRMKPLNAIIAKLQHLHGPSWIRYLYEYEMAVNTTPDSVRRDCPCFLALALDIPPPAQPNANTSLRTSNELSTTRQHILQTLALRQELAAQRILDTRLAQKDRWDGNHKDPDFQVGQPVWMSTAQGTTRPHKFDLDHYVGPMRIRKLTDDRMNAWLTFNGVEIRNPVKISRLRTAVDEELLPYYIDPNNRSYTMFERIERLFAPSGSTATLPAQPLEPSAPASSSEPSSSTSSLKPPSATLVSPPTPAEQPAPLPPSPPLKPKPATLPKPKPAALEPSAPAAVQAPQTDHLRIKPQPSLSNAPPALAATNREEKPDAGLVPSGKVTRASARSAPPAPKPYVNFKWPKATVDEARTALAARLKSAQSVSVALGEITACQWLSEFGSQLLSQSVYDTFCSRLPTISTRHTWVSFLSDLARSCSVPLPAWLSQYGF